MLKWKGFGAVLLFILVAMALAALAGGITWLLFTKPMFGFPLFILLLSAFIYLKNPEDCNSLADEIMDFFKRG